MLRFTFVLDRTGNQSFGERTDPDTGRTSIDATEVARLLRLTAHRIGDSRLTVGDGGALLDYNGHKVGSWSVS